MAGAGQAGASSSYASTSTDRSLTYDVFLNFRGEDTRKGFTGHLYSALNRERINVFMDSHKLWEGEEIGPKLMEAIQGSKISIPIFSKGYADSKWCLMELEKILECHKSNHQIVLPIFFDVKPSDVRHQSGRSFENAFLEHERNSQPEKVKCWREALNEVGSMKGWVLNQIDNGDESTLIQRVVERILRETSSIYLSDAKYPVGLDSHVNAIRSLLHIGSKDVRFIGICGEGGIGKTTTAKAVYNLFIKSFHQNCFLQNIREEALGGSNGIVSLQEKLIYSITKRKVTGEISLVDRGKEEIRNRCQGVNVLLVLDDVDDRSQLDALAIDLKWLGQGSRVIITTRDEHVLNVANIDPNNIYRPKELDFGQSLRLFSLHAFQQDEPFEEYKKLSRDVANYSGGLPLTLEVLGSYLSDVRNKEEWENTLQKLRASPHKEVYKKLKISYDNLEDADQKAIFLDAACFFVGWKKRDVISLWEACEYHPKLAIKRLVQRSLLKFIAKTGLVKYLEMHDQIRDMGRQIVLEESCGMLGKRSRLWTRKEIVEVLEGHKGTEYIKGIHLPGQLIDFPIRSFCLPTECLEKMSNLRFLDMRFAHFKVDDFPHFPRGLRWLNWNYCPIKVLPDNFYHERLVHLDLSFSRIQLAWHIRPQNEYKFQNLKVLKLELCPISICPDFSWFPSLEQLDLHSCNELFGIDESIGQLSHLKSLNLGYCRSLKKLPESIGDLKSLLELDLEESEIEELPDSICKLSSLQRLDLTRCQSFNRLPEFIGDLKSLLELNLRKTNINELPDSICKLSSLQRLGLSQCQSLNKLPESIGDLKSLPELDLQGAKINELPDSICRLSSIQRLDLRKCKSLNKLPESVGDLKSLLELDLQGAKINELPDSICRLSSLQRLDLRQCKSLNRLPESVGDLKSLLELDLEETEIEELPYSICRLSSLQRLDLTRCQSLNRLPESIGDLKSLVVLKLDNTQIGELPKSVGLLEKLEILSVRHCRNPVKLPRSMGRMGCLHKIYLEGTELATDFPMLSSLVELRMTCECNVVGIPFSGFSHLQRLALIDCTTLEALPADFSNLKNLRELVLSKLKKLRYLLELPSSLNSLECLACTSLERLPDLSTLKSLRKLHLTDCYRVEKIRGLGGLKSLEEFLVMGCHYKVLQGRPLFVDGNDCGIILPPLYFGIKKYSFLNANDGIHKQLYLIIVFAFNSHVKEKLKEGEPVDIELIVSAKIESLRCCHSIFIENVEFTASKRDIIYIHNLQGFTWFGLPLGGKDVMREIKVTGYSLYKLSDSGVYHRICGSKYCVELKSWSLEYVNEDSGKALPNQELGDNKTLIDVLSGPWPHADADAGAGSHRVFVSHSAFIEQGHFRSKYIVSNYGNVRPCLRDTKERIYFVLEGPHEEDNNTIEMNRFDSNYPLEEPEEDKRSIIEEIDSHPVLGEDEFSSACVDGGGSHSVPLEEEKSDKMTDPFPWELLLF